MLKCPACEKEIPDDSKFCKECGYSFSGGSQTGQLNPDTILENRYIIVKTLGRGGMGAVYMALDSRLNNIPVAIKEMSTRAVGGDLQAAIGAFKKEASMLINLRHPALPRILDFFSRGEDRWYLVMDFIEGQTLAELAQSRGPLPEAEVLDWARQICEILDYLHQQNPPIIFRDLKPANIMLTPKGQIKLIDFGIARHFRVGSSADTAAYGSHGFAPPEQYGENQTSPSSDIYALGATMHYLLTGIDPGKNPFVFESPGKSVKVSPSLDKAIMQALELKAENRPKSMREMLQLLPGGEAHPDQRDTADLMPETSLPMEKASTVVQPVSNSLDSDTRTMPIKDIQKHIVTAPIDVSPPEASTLPLQSATANTGNNQIRPSNQDIGTGAGSNKITNIALAACLIIALMVGGVYAFNHKQADNTKDTGGNKIALTNQKETDNNQLADIPKEINNEVKIPEPDEEDNPKVTNESKKEAVEEEKPAEKAVEADKKPESREPIVEKATDNKPVAPQHTTQTKYIITINGNESEICLGSNIISTNGATRLMDVKPMLVGNDVFLPPRYIGEDMLGNAAVSWDQVSKTLIIENGNSSFEAKLGSTVYTFNGSSITGPQAPFISDGRTWIPVKFTINVFNGQVRTIQAGV